MFQIVYLPTGDARIQRIADGAFVPNDPRNSDYHAFTEWNKAQSVPLSLASFVAPVVTPPIVNAAPPDPTPLPVQPAQPSNS